MAEFALRRALVGWRWVMLRLALTVSCVLSASCLKCTNLSVEATPGSGTIITQPRAVGEFDSVEVQTGLSAEVVVGEKLSVDVQGDDNLVPRVSTVVREGQLVIRVSNGRGDSIAPTRPIVAHIKVPEAVALEANTGATLHASKVSTEHLELKVATGGTLWLAGDAQHVSIEASTGGTLEGTELVSQEAEVDASTGAEVSITAKKSIRSETTAGARVHVKGSPPTRELGDSRTDVE